MASTLPPATACSAPGPVDGDAAEALLPAVACPGDDEAPHDADGGALWAGLLEDVAAASQRDTALGGAAGRPDDAVRHQSEGWVPLERALKRLQGYATRVGGDAVVGGVIPGIPGTPQAAPKHIPGTATPIHRPMGPFGADAAAGPPRHIPGVPGTPQAAATTPGTPGTPRSEVSFGPLPEATPPACCTPAIALSILHAMGPCVTHENRFIREAAFGVVEGILNLKGEGLPLGRGGSSELCPLPASAAEAPSDSGRPGVREGGGQSDPTSGSDVLVWPGGGGLDDAWRTLLGWICSGLQDNWSQVRYRASHAAKAFAAHHMSEEAYPTLLPRLCLNRYYIAEGVRVVTLRLWKDIVGEGGGASLVEKHATHFVEYYCAQVKEKNHAVREAACHCIAEIVRKVPNMGPFVHRLLDAIDEACDDPSWPVRDIACMSASYIVAAYPDLPEAMHERAYRRFLFQAEDPIPSVRLHAAEALAIYAKVSDAAKGKVLLDLESMLSKIDSQPESKSVSTDLANVTEFGVAKRQHDNDVAAHTGKPMYGCGSLSPGPSTARVLGGGCSGGHGIPRTGLDPWFATDTAVSALRCLAEGGAVPCDVLLPLLKRIPATLRHKQFVQYPTYWQTVWRSVPPTVKALGKRPLTGWVSDLLPCLFEALQCDSRLTAAAAADCIIGLRRLYGPSVWESKLDPVQAQMMNHPLIRMV